MKLKAIFFMMGIVCLVMRLSAQVAKKILTDDRYQNWAELKNYGISPDGKYVWYERSESEEDRTMIVSGNNTDILGEFKVRNGSRQFTADGRYLVFDCGIGSSGSGLIISYFDVVKKKLNEENNVNCYQLAGNQLIYRQDSLVYIKKLSTGETYQYPGLEYVCHVGSDLLAIRTKKRLILVNLQNGDKSEIISSESISHIVFSAEGDQIAFMRGKGDDLVICNYSVKTKTLKIVADRDRIRKELDRSLLNEPITFSSGGNYLLFRTAYAADAEKVTDKPADLKIWNYLDIYNRYPNVRPIASVSLNTGKIVGVENSNAKIYHELKDEVSFDRAVVSSVVFTDEITYDGGQYPAYELVSLKDGSRTKLQKEGSRIAKPVFSPTGKFLSWFDYNSKDVIVLELKSGKHIKLTNELNAARLNEIKGSQESIIYLASFERYWTKDDQNLLLEDFKDIWLTYPLGDKTPINLTAKYAGTYKRRFKLADNRERIGKLKTGEEVLVTVLEDSTNFNGLFKMKLEPNANIVQLIKPGPYFYFFPNSMSVREPIRATAAQKYLIRRESSNSAMNLELLNMNSEITKFTNIRPEKDYNWLTTELHHFKTEEGEVRKGILYKPEDFDPRKKYPVIFYYYDMLSIECYRFKTPGYSYGPINIPNYVSNGYLIFVPDIWAKTGNIGQSALASLEGAARYLKANFPWVDVNHMGLQGHSFGGYYTNFVAVNSKMFAAAQSSAGPSDILRQYGDLSFGGAVQNYMAEYGQMNMGNHPWAIRENYIKNSPFFQADQCTTPLLLQHGDSDFAVPIGQARSLFIALRRLHKPAWLLEYKDEDHTLGKLENYTDFTRRQREFFDHYLKGKPMPKWMKEGVGRF